MMYKLYQYMQSVLALSDDICLCAAMSVSIGGLKLCLKAHTHDL